jgi:single-stranded DNA-binding protein
MVLDTGNEVSEKSSFRTFTENEGLMFEILVDSAANLPADVVEKYVKKGTKIVISGHIQTGSYTNRDGVKVYTTDVITESVEFAESKKAAGESTQSEPHTDSDGFMNVPDEIDDELPFS